MQTTEVIVYFVIAILLGGLVIGFMTGFNYGKLYDNLNGAMFGGEKKDFEKIPPLEFGMKVFDVSEKCSSDRSHSVLTYVEKTGANSEINMSVTFTPIKKFNLCYSVQSKSLGCGEREDVVIEGGKILLPALVKINCTSAGFYVKKV